MTSEELDSYLRPDIEQQEEGVEPGIEANYVPTEEEGEEWFWVWS
jgi:hypothetical protein